MEHREQHKLERLQVPEIGDLLHGRYRVQGVIATGGMGVILRAEQLPMERPVAIKLLHPHIAAADPDIADRFDREVRLAKQLNHPNTIRLYDSGKSEQGLVYVAMELLEGMNLKRLIARESGLSVDRALEICRQVLDGLAEAHAHDFIHRDLKPSNVFITTNRRGEDVVKLLDFGIAKSLTDAADLTGPGSICGTPSYVAPEYLRQEEAGKPSDVYAVGLILLEMLTGRPVFKGETPVQTMMMHLKLDPQLPKELEGTALAGVIERATVKDPRARFQDAEAMYKAVCEACEGISNDLLARRPKLPPPLPGGAKAVEPQVSSAEQCRVESDTIVAMANPHRASDGRGSEVVARAALIAMICALVMGAGLFWLLDPGQAPELEVPPTNAESAAATDSAPKPAPSGQQSESGEAALVEPGSASARSGDEDPAGTDEVRWQFDLDTDPSGAVVTVGDRPLGRTPLSHQFAPEQLPNTVRFELEGYQALEVELTRSSSPIVVEVLEKEVVEEKVRRSSRDARRARRERRSKQKRSTEAEASPADRSNQGIEEVMNKYLVE